jgi:hypothetical protein
LLQSCKTGVASACRLSKSELKVMEQGQALRAVVCHGIYVQYAILLNFEMWSWTCLLATTPSSLVCEEHPMLVFAPLDLSVDAHQPEFHCPGTEDAADRECHHRRESNQIPGRIRLWPQICTVHISEIGKGVDKGVAD